MKRFCLEDSSKIYSLNFLQCGYVIFNVVMAFLHCFGTVVMCKISSTTVVSEFNRDETSTFLSDSHIWK